MAMSSILEVKSFQEGTGSEMPLPAHNTVQPTVSALQDQIPCKLHTWALTVLSRLALN